MRGNAATLRREYNSGGMSLFGVGTTRQTLRRTSNRVQGRSDLRKLKKTVNEERKVSAQKQRQDAAKARHQREEDIIPF